MYTKYVTVYNEVHVLHRYQSIFCRAEKGVTVHPNLDCLQHHCYTHIIYVHIHTYISIDYAFVKSLFVKCS